MKKSFFFMVLIVFLVQSIFVPFVNADADQGCTDHHYDDEINDDQWRQAQTFKLSSTHLSRLSFYMRRVDNPGDLTIKLKDGNPGSSDVLKTWTVSPSEISTSYSWVDVTCSFNDLLPDHTYSVCFYDSPSSSSWEFYQIKTSETGSCYSDGSRWDQQFYLIWWDWGQKDNDLNFKIWEQLAYPNADFTWEEDAITPLEVIFDASGSSDDSGIVSYEWDFDNDGSYEVSESDPVTTYQFGDYGTHPVSLRVTDEDGLTDTISKNVMLETITPTACFTYTYEDLTIDVSAQCSSGNGESIIAYRWDWDDSDGIDFDNPDDTGLTEAHTYSSNGTYTITLQVENNGGSTNTYDITQLLETGSSGTGDDNGESSGFSGDWFNFMLNLPSYIILMVVAIVFIMVSATAFFMKPEIISRLGVVPAVSSLFMGILAIAAIMIWYAELELYYMYGCIIGLLLVLALNVKYFFGGRK